MVKIATSVKNPLLGRWLRHRRKLRLRISVRSLPSSGLFVFSKTSTIKRFLINSINNMKKIKILIIALMLVTLPSTTFAYTELQLREIQIEALQNIISLLIEQMTELNKQLLAQIQVKEVVGLSLENPNRDMFTVTEAIIIEPEKEKPEGWYSVDRPCYDMEQYYFSGGKCNPLRAYDKSNYNPPIKQSCPVGYEYYKSTILKNYGNGIVGKCRKL